MLMKRIKRRIWAALKIQKNSKDRGKTDARQSILYRS